MPPTSPNLSRRAFLGGSAAVGAAAVVGGLGGVAIAAAAPEERGPTLAVPGYIPFGGDHQAGIVSPARPQSAAMFVALDAVVGSRPELVMTLGEVTTRIRQLTAGWAPDAGDQLFPPPDSGILGPRSARPT